jgi:hypothetical protein
MKRHCKSQYQFSPATAALVSLAGVAASSVVAAASPTPSVISDIDLSRPFGTRAPWRFTATQGPPIQDPIYGNGDMAPGPIKFCLRANPSSACDPQLASTLETASPSDVFADLHYLYKVEIVRPRGAAGHPLLLVRAAGLHSGDNNQGIFTQVFAYRQAQDRFARVYQRVTGSNNSQETRYIAAGPLRGDIISVEPTGNAPFGFWVSVSTFTPHDTYRQVLRYRSATRYSDGNTLAVIDSEMPNIEQCLGVWRPQAPLPLPAGPCPKPHLIRTELWCR